MARFSGQVGPDKPINMFGSQVSAVAHAAVILWIPFWTISLSNNKSGRCQALWTSKIVC